MSDVCALVHTHCCAIMHRPLSHPDLRSFQIGKGMSRTRRHPPRAASVFLAAGLLALGYVAYVVADAKMYQAIEQKRFESLRGIAAVSPELAASGRR